MRRRRTHPAPLAAFCLIPLALCATAIARADAPGLPPGILAATPPPGARYVHAETTLLLRLARAFPAGARDDAALAVSGSASGAHPGRLESLEDGTLLRFTPDRPFAAGERVAVTLGAPLSPAGAGAAYTFEIARERRAPARSALARLGLASPAARGARPDAVADTLPLGFPAIASAVSGSTAPGRLFLASFSGEPGTGSYLLIVGDDGRVLWYRRMAGVCADFKVQPDGRLTYFDSVAGRFFVLDSTYTVVDSVSAADGYATDVHELRWLPDGHWLLLCDDPQVVDMSALVPGGAPEAVVTGMVIQELDAGGAPVFSWRSWDHFQITDATHEDLTANAIDYVHANAIEVDSDGNLLLSSRHLDEITKIDRRTGDIRWRWGGFHNQFTFLDDTLAFSHQHAVRRLADGHVTLFDNGNFHVPPFSRAVEYALDESLKTARRVWEYRGDPDIYGYAMGYVQRLANGNTLVGWGMGKPDVVEVGPDGRPVLTLSFPAGVHSYRAYRYDWSPADTASLAESPALESLSGGRPNPTASATDVIVSLPAGGVVTLEVYDVSGRRVSSLIDHVPHSSGVYRAHVDLAGRPSGVYFCRLTVGRHTQTRAIVLAR